MYDVLYEKTRSERHARDVVWAVLAGLAPR